METSALTTSVSSSRNTLSSITLSNVLRSPRPSSFSALLDLPQFSSSSTLSLPQFPTWSDGSFLLISPSRLSSQRVPMMTSNGSPTGSSLVSSTSSNPLPSDQSSITSPSSMLSRPSSSSGSSFPLPRQVPLTFFELKIIINIPKIGCSYFVPQCLTPRHGQLEEADQGSLRTR